MDLKETVRPSTTHAARGGLLRRLSREPLLHFFVAASLLFVMDAWRGGDGSPESAPAPIAVTPEHLNWLAQTWQRQWGKAPNDDELRELVAELVKQELLAREARELGLDDGDTIVQRRLAQKMTFLIEDAATEADPGDDQLRTWHAAHADRFLPGDLVSFEQVYFNPERRGTRLSEDVQRTLETLRAEASPVRTGELGDRLLVDLDASPADQATLAAVYGPAFASAVAGLPVGSWTGPVSSGFGVHLVRVSARTPVRPRSFDEDRGRVLEEWRRERRDTALQEHLAQLSRRHPVQTTEDLRRLLPEWPR